MIPAAAVAVEATPAATLPLEEVPAPGPAPYDEGYPVSPGAPASWEEGAAAPSPTTSPPEAAPPSPSEEGDRSGSPAVEEASPASTSTPAAPSAPAPAKVIVPSRPAAAITTSATAPAPAAAATAAAATAAAGVVTGGVRKTTVLKPKGPAWPMLPMTVVESKDPSSFWDMVAGSGVDRSKLLVFCLDAPGSVSATYGLAGATFWRISRSEGEDSVAPGDVDRMGYLLESFLGKGTGRAVVFRGIERIADSAGLKSTVRLLEVAREVAESTRGAILVYLNPENLEASERRQLEEGAKVIRVLGSGKKSADE